MLILLAALTQWSMPDNEAKYLCHHAGRLAPAAESSHTFDVLKYELKATLPMTSRSITGLNRIRCRSLEDNLLRLAFHAYTITVDSVRVDGATAAYAQSGDSVSINLPHPYNNNDTFVVDIGYHGSWSIVGNQVGFVYYPKGYSPNVLHAIAYTIGEPWDARRWMPCYDEPYDKAEQGCVINVTVPDTFVVCANGALTSVQNNPGNTKTFNWQENFPVTTYLMHFGVSRYAQWSAWFHPAAGDSVEIRHFMWPQDSAQSVGSFQYLPLAMALFDSMYGSYPFDRYGQDVVYPYVWGGMEHQEQTTIHRSWLLNQSENGMAHELAHMWWGDMVTCIDFRDIWLNEGCATYSDANYNWRRFGYNNFLQTMQARAGYYFEEDSIWRHPLYDPPLNEIFNYGYTYCKGSWIVHMLRYLDPAGFFAAMAGYRSAFEYGLASTEDLKSVFSGVYGTDLTWFFDEWVYDQGYPVYEVYWYCLPSTGNYRVQIRVRQVQTDAPPVFHMPVQILLHMGAADTLVNIAVTSAAQYAEFIVSDSVTAIAFDPDRWLLKQYAVFYGCEENLAGDRGGQDRLLLANPLRKMAIEYEIAVPGKIKIALFDASGRMVKQLYCGSQHAGMHRLALPPIATGVYFCRLDTPRHAITRKVVVVR